MRVCTDERAPGISSLWFSGLRAGLTTRGFTGQTIFRISIGWDTADLRLESLLWKKLKKFAALLERSVGFEGA